MFVLGDEEKTKKYMLSVPMTCPFQYYVYKAAAQLPWPAASSYGETSTVLRNEDSGQCMVDTCSSVYNFLNTSDRKT